MGAIYTSARLTLIAAAGLDPSHGLPGVSEARSSSYRDADVGNVCVAYVPPTVHRAVTMSRWSTRGWTLQEGYLSRRRLYFTESAVMFICNQGQEYEGFQLPMSESDVYVLHGTLDPRALGAKNRGYGGLSEIMRLLEQYTKRTLTYDYDAVNAISGILNYHHAENQETGTVWGLPYQLPHSGPRILCINWRHLKTSTRRLGYPSWSPLGWDGPIRFLSDRCQFNMSVEDAMEISNHTRDERRDRNLQEVSQYLRITVSIHQFHVVYLSKISANHVDMPPSVPKAFLVLPIGDTVNCDTNTRIYLPMDWDAATPDRCDSTQVVCAVTNDSEYRHLAVLILTDHGSYYERVGFATPDSKHRDTQVLKAARFEDLASTAEGIRTYSAKDHVDFTSKAQGDDVEDLAWLRNTKKVTITLG